MVFVLVATLAWAGFNAPHAARAAAVLATMVPVLLLSLNLAAMPAFPSAVQARVMTGFAWAIMLAGAFLAFEGATGGMVIHALGLDKNPEAPLISYNRGLCSMAVLLFALMPPKPSVALWALPALAMALGASSTAQLALLMGGLTYALARTRNKNIQALAALVPAAVLVVCLAVPLWAPALVAAQPHVLTLMPDSWAHRLEIWDSLSRHLAQHPLTGVGLGNIPTLPVGAGADLYQHHRFPISHAHNMVLQLVVELGWLAALPWLGLVVRALWAAHLWMGPPWAGQGPPSIPHARAQALAVMAAALTVAATGFDVWNDNFWATCALAWWVVRHQSSVISDQ
ncbi:MAG: hypothetical protein EBZ69_04210 [Alphaproteobacteria bacterium]|nr:hypothetical protein [Alphaproteobacteria bacterium]